MSNVYIKTCEKFFQMEQELNLFDWQVDGIYVWELMRFQVFSDIMQKMGLYGQPHTGIKQTVVTRIKKFFSSFYNYLFKNPFYIPKNKIVFIGHQRRKLFPDGKYWDIYCDPLIDQVDADFCLLESYYLNGHLKPAKTKELFYADFIDFVAFFLNRIFKILKRSKISNNGKCGELKLKIKANFNINIPVEFVLKNQTTGFYSMTVLYSLLFEFIKPKLILVLVGYGNEAKINAAKRKHIPVIEMQHGTLSPYHVGYNFPKGKIKHYFADYFFSFGDFWKHAANFPISRNNIKTIGYPYLSTALEKYKHVKKKELIVFISQGSIGRELAKFAVRLRKITPEKINMIFKLHPGEYDRWKQEYPFLLDSGIDVVDSQTPDLYQLLAVASWQIGVYSTAIYEGLAFDCTTYLVDLPGVAYMDKLIESGRAKLVEQPEDIQLHKNKSHIDTDYFFAKDWENNFIIAINEIGILKSDKYI